MLMMNYINSKNLHVTTHQKICTQGDGVGLQIYLEIVARVNPLQRKPVNAALFSSLGIIITKP